jgi:hypothetical protein
VRTFFGAATRFRPADVRPGDNHWTQQLRSTCVDICFFIAFLVYPGNSAIIFAVYSCESFDDGTSFLKADYSIDCNDPAHAVMVTYATLMFLVYPIGYAPATSACPRDAALYRMPCRNAAQTVRCPELCFASRDLI